MCYTCLPGWFHLSSSHTALFNVNLPEEESFIHPHLGLVFHSFFHNNAEFHEETIKNGDLNVLSLEFATFYRDKGKGNYTAGNLLPLKQDFM